MKPIKILFFVFLFSAIPLNFVSAQEEPPPPPPEKVEMPDYPFFFKMDKKKEKELLEKLTASLRENMKSIKKLNEEKYYELLRDSQFRSMHFPFSTKRDKQVREREEKIFELEVQSEALASKYTRASKSDRKKIKADLVNTLDQLFELKETNRKHEVETLEKELSKLKKELNLRLGNKNEIIKRRVQELLGEDDYLKWE